MSTPRKGGSGSPASPSRARSPARGIGCSRSASRVETYATGLPSGDPSLSFMRLVYGLRRAQVVERDLQQGAPADGQRGLVEEEARRMVARRAGRLGPGRHRTDEEE